MFPYLKHTHIYLSYFHKRGNRKKIKEKGTRTRMGTDTNDKQTILHNKRHFNS